MIDNYDDLTVDETLDAVADFDEDELAEFVRFEKANQDRVGVVNPLEADLDHEVEPESSDEETTDATDGAELSEESDERPDDLAVVTDPDEVEVTKAEGYGYVAGLWFDDADESKTVERNTRIHRAIERGELEVVV